MKKRILALILTLCMCLTLFPIAALGEEDEAPAEAEMTQVQNAEIESYPTGHPNTWVNTGNQAYDVAQIALTQVGYKENSSGITKYHVWYYGYESSVPWCAIFASWCYNQAGVTNITYGAASAPKFFGVPGYSFGGIEPETGDLAFVENDGDGSGDDHTALIVSVDENYIYTVEGNIRENGTYGVVSRKYYKSGSLVGNSSVYIAVIGRPELSSSSAVPTVNVSTKNHSATVSWENVGAESYYLYVQNLDTLDIPFGNNLGKAFRCDLLLTPGKYRVWVTAVYSNDVMQSGYAEFNLYDYQTTTDKGINGNYCVGESITFSVATDDYQKCYYVLYHTPINGARYLMEEGTVASNHIAKCFSSAGVYEVAFAVHSSYGYTEASYAFANVSNHSYSYTVAKKPTVSTTGTLTGTCSRCSAKTNVTLPKLNTKDYTYAVIKAATCTATGTGRYTWKTTTYGTFYFDVTISKTAHTYASTVTAPTCTEKGYTTHTCSGCGDTYKDSYVDALGHDYNYVVMKNPTAMTTGNLTGTCSCGDTATVTLPKLSTTDYTYKVTKEAGCTEDGSATYTWKTTTYGSFAFNVTLSKLGHDYHDGKCSHCGADDPNVSTTTKLIISNETARKGETVVVKLSVKEAPPLKSMAITGLTYDKNVLELVKGEWKLENSVIASWDSKNETGVIAFSENVDVNNTILELSFKVKDSAADGDYDISCLLTASTKLQSGAETAIAVGTEKGKITVVSVIRGDVNGDNLVTSDDAIYLLYHTLMPSLYPINQNADFNGDGMVTSDDAIHLLYHTLMPSLYPLH